jgi:hypothetical protein
MYIFLVYHILRSKTVAIEEMHSLIEKKTVVGRYVGAGGVVVKCEGGKIRKGFGFGTRAERIHCCSCLQFHLKKYCI